MKRHSILALVLFLFISSFSSFAQWTTIASGNWSDPAIWNTGTVPQTWGNITITVSHNVNLDANPQANTIALTVDAGVSLTETGGCRTITTWAAGSNFINNGTIDCYYIDLPSATFVNNGTVILDDFQMYGAGDFTNNASGNLTSAQIGIYNNTNLTNYGSITVTGVSSPCFTPPGGVSLFEFSGDVMYNNGTIDAVGIGISACVSVTNDTLGVISSDDYLDLAGVSLFDNYGDIDMQGNLQVTNSTVNNYDYISVGDEVQNNSNATINNYGCDCYTQYNGIIDVVNSFNITNSSGVVDNNGIINVAGGLVTVYGQMGASLCGKLDITPTGVLEAYNGSLLFGDLVIIAGTVNCFSCTQEPSVYVTTDSNTGCDYALILPVELVAFDAQKEHNMVKCSWVTNIEVNSDYFTIERTQNGTSIDSVGQHPASGNSLEENSYYLYDASPYDGVSYYRLKSVDMDGSYEYSNWRSVNFEGFDIINLYPNPANTNLTVLVGSSTNDNVSIEVVDPLGRYVYYETTQIFAGITSFFIDVSQYASGTYIFKVATDSKTFVQKQFVVN